MDSRLSKYQTDVEEGPDDRGLTGAPSHDRPLLAYLVPPSVAIGLLLVVWYLWTSIADVPVYIVPGPVVVVQRLFGDIGFFAGHGGVTLLEALAGFALGSTIGIGAATVMAHSLFVERTLYPLAVLVKVTPIVAVAPLFVIWFGFSAFPNVLIAALITFFPVMVNTLTGLRSVNPGALDLFKSLDASKMEILLKLRAPSSLPYTFAAVRIAVPLSVIGAVVGEFFSGDRGLGNVIFVAHHNLDMPTAFSAIAALAAIGIGLSVVTAYLEKRVLFWHESSLAV